MNVINLDLQEITLTQTSNPTRTKSMDLLEAVAWFSGEPHCSDPKSVDLLLRTIAARLASTPWIGNDTRTQLFRDLIPHLAKTAGKIDQDRVRFLFADAAVRNFLPRVMGDLAHPQSDAEARICKELRELPPVTDWASAMNARQLVTSLFDRGTFCNEIREVVGYACGAVSNIYAPNADPDPRMDCAAMIATIRPAIPGDLSLLRSAINLLRKACVDSRLPEAKS